MDRRLGGSDGREEMTASPTDAQTELDQLIRIGQPVEPLC